MGYLKHILCVLIFESGVVVSFSGWNKFQDMVFLKKL